MTHLNLAHSKNEELIRIQNILYNNGFPLQLTDKFQKKQEKLKTCKENIEDSTSHKQKHVTFTFFGYEIHCYKNFQKYHLMYCT